MDIIVNTSKAKAKGKTKAKATPELLAWATVPKIRGTEPIPPGPEPVRKLLAAVRRNLKAYMKNYEEEHNRERGRYLLKKCKAQVKKHGSSAEVCACLIDTVIKIPYYVDSEGYHVSDEWMGNE